MQAKCSADATAAAWLAANTRWPRRQRETLAALAPVLLERLPGEPPWLLALGGPPGTGKSTLSRLLDALWRAHRPAQAGLQVLSLDDYYLPRVARADLAARVHPALARRGVPGTHDVDRLFEHAQRLLSGAKGTVAIPVFDKGRDDRVGPPRRIRTGGRPSPVLVEGWFAGTPPESDAALEHPLTPFEQAHDADGRWRRTVNRALGEFDAWLSAQHALRWHLAAPSWSQVREWRWTQERELPAARRLLPDRDAVAAFLAPFERIARHQFAGAGTWADLLITLDTAHRPHLESAP